MRCFIISCFHTSRHKKLQNPRNRTTASFDLVHEKCEETLNLMPTYELHPAEAVIDQIAQSKDEYAKELNSSSRKKVTFSLDAETYEEGPSPPIQEAAAADRLVKIIKKRKEGSTVEGDTLSDSITSSTSFISYAPDQRYHCCKSRGYEVEDLELNESDLEDDANGGGDEDGGALIQEESSESLFSISLDSRKQISAAERGDREVNSPLKQNSELLEAKPTRTNQNAGDRGRHVHHSLLNPDENLGPLKAAMARASSPLPSLNQRGKENVKMELESIVVPRSEEPSIKQQQPVRKCDQTNSTKNEVAVDTSLSNWLVISDKASNTNNTLDSASHHSSESINSSSKLQERPVLGEISVEQIKQLSSKCSSPSNRADEVHILGTVGSFWRHTGQATTESGSASSNKGGSSLNSVEMGEVSCNSTTPFERGVAQV